MIATPQSPNVEQRPAPEAQPPTERPTPAAIPPAATPFQPAPPPTGWYVPMYGTPPTSTASQQLLFRPTGGQRVGVAIASLALLIPLVAIAVGTMNSLMPYVAAGVAVSAGLIAVALVCLAVVVVNIAFNFDLMRTSNRQ